MLKTAVLFFGLIKKIASSLFRHQPKESTLNPQELLIEAIYRDDVTLFEEALKNGAKIHLSAMVPIEYLTGTTYESHASRLKFMRLQPLHFAVALHRNMTLRYIVHNDPQSLLDKDYCGDLPLHVASQHNHWDLFPSLISQNREPNIDLPNATGNTALHLAACNGHADSVRALLELKANLSLLNEYSLTPLQCANSRHHSAAAGILVEELSRVRQLEIARVQGLRTLWYDLDRINYRKNAHRQPSGSYAPSWSYRL